MAPSHHDTPLTSKLRGFCLRCTVGGLSVLLGLLVCEALLRIIPLVQVTGATFSVYDPIYGKRLKPNFSSQKSTPEFVMRMTTNSLGFRGPEPGPMTGGSIIFLGDSFTMGYGVNDGEEFAAIIRAQVARRGSGIEVLNAGLAGSGNGRWVKFLKAESAQYNPSIVVLQAHWTDYDDNLEERLFEVDPDGGLHALPTPPRTWLRVGQDVIERVPGLGSSYLASFARQVFVKRPKDRGARLPGPGEVKAGETLFLRLLEEATTICTRRGYQVVVLLVDMTEPLLRRLYPFLEEHGVVALDVPRIDTRPDLYYPVDKHWNASGHDYVAARLMDVLDPMLR